MKYNNITDILCDGGLDLLDEFSGDQEDYNLIEKGKKIPINYGCGIKLMAKNELLISNDINDNLDVDLQISSYRGFSIDAIHYYGRLKFSTPHVHPPDKPNIRIMGYKIPRGIGIQEIALHRVVTRTDLHDYPGRFRPHELGGYTNAFNNVEDIVERAKEVFNKVFEKGWTLKIENDINRYK